MQKKPFKHLSSDRLSELCELAKLKTMSPKEEALDRSYLESMIALAAKIHTIPVHNLLPATHAFDVKQRLRKDQVIKSEGVAIYQQLAPKVAAGLYAVPAVIESTVIE